MEDLRTIFGRRRSPLAAALLLGAAAAASAQEAPAKRWSWTGKLSAVWVTGNSESSTLGLGSTVRRLGEVHRAKLEAGAIRTDASLKTRRAVGTPGAFRVEEQEERQRTAESYFARGRYDRKIEGGLSGFAGADWLRNTFAGVDSRLLFAAGVGQAWADSERFRLRTDVAATYTFQQQVVENPFVKQNFPGLRVSADLLRALTETTVWESALISDLNASDTDDVRVDFTNSLALTISSRLALTPSLQLLWLNLPALTEVPLFTAGVETGEVVLVPLEKLDSVFTLALVVTL